MKRNIRHRPANAKFKKKLGCTLLAFFAAEYISPGFIARSTKLVEHSIQDTYQSAKAILSPAAQDNKNYTPPPPSWCE